MGRKRAGRRQHFHFCLALLIFVTGCAAGPNAGRQRTAGSALQAGDRLLAHGDYKGALGAFHDAAAVALNEPPADVAVFKTGVIYAHPNNPERDMDKAIAAFSQVVSSYPTSLWAEQARAWIGVLKETADARRNVEQSRQAMEKWQLESERNRQAIEKSKQEIERSRLELDKTRQEIEKTKQVIEKSKQVDIEIDNKRRDRGR